MIHTCGAAVGIKCVYIGDTQWAPNKQLPESPFSRDLILGKEGRGKN